MRILVFILGLLLTSCSVELSSGVSEKLCQLDDSFSRSTSTHCLRDFLVGEDDGGVWTIITAPSGFTPTLTGDNPCLNFSVAPSGSYTLRYTVTTACCTAFTDVVLIKCGLSGISLCNN